MIGRAKAAVFPVPVCARPITSLPAIASGMNAAWMGVGLSYPAAATSSNTLPAKE